MRRIRVGAVAVAATVAGGLLAGCGGSGDETTATQANTASGPQHLTITMSDFKFDPSAPTLPAGRVQISAPNVGDVEHEMVVFKTDRAPNALPTKGNEADEEGFEETAGAENMGEIEEVEPGETKSNTFNLTPGKYVMICNVPGHYAAGMYGTLTVD